jgi:hypothetical protein
MKELLSSAHAPALDAHYDPETERYLPQRKVAERYGCSIMSLWRRERHPSLNFPRSLLIGNRRVYRLSDLLRFELECAARSAPSSLAEDRPIGEAGRRAAAESCRRKRAAAAPREAAG